MSISEIIKEGENTEVEFKELMNEKGFKSVSAFSNTEGGTLLCGVSDNGNIVGFDCSDGPVRAITTKIMNIMGIYPLINCFELEGKKVLRISFLGKTHKNISLMQ